MYEFEWADLKPAEKALFVLLTISAVAASFTAVVMTVKVILEWFNYKKTDELVKVAHELLLADSKIRQDVYKRTQNVERVAEGTHEAIQVLQKKADKVERAAETAKEAAEHVKQVVVEGATPQSLPRPTILPTERPPGK